MSEETGIKRIKDFKIFWRNKEIVPHYVGFTSTPFCNKCIFAEGIDEEDLAIKCHNDITFCWLNDDEGLYWTYKENEV